MVPAAPRLDGAPGARRDVGEIVGARRSPRRREVEAEAELGEQGELEADIALQPRAVLNQNVNQMAQVAVQIRMRVALRQACLEQRAGRRRGRSADPADRGASAATGASGSSVKLPNWSASRARQVACTRLPI